jgi:signal transduction histidine kinase
MNHKTRLHHDAATIRLIFTYLSIIMCLSIGFSIIFYRTSTESLDSLTVRANGIQIMKTAQTAPAPTPVPSNNEELLGISGTNSTGAGPTLITRANANTLNTQLQQGVHQIRVNLVRHLLILNSEALVCSSIFSYFLARRTLHPMEEAMDTQSRFSSDASHELRTPLTALRTRNEVALRKSELTLREAKTVIQTSVEQTIKLEKLSDGLLRLSRNDRTNLQKTPVTLSDVVTEATNRIIEPAQVKHINIDDTLPDITVMGDAESLTQIVTILLDNAIKYSQAGGTIHLEGESKGKYGLLHVRDEGIGIRATDLPHIFERFYRADYARTKYGNHGYGLGLSIAKKLIIQNKGDISVESTLDEGTIFTLTLPLAKAMIIHS